MRAFSLGLAAFTALFLLTGCLGITQPSEKTLLTQTSQHFNEAFAGLFSVVQVEKENGYKQNDTHYVASMIITARAERSLEEHSKYILQSDALSALEKMRLSVHLGLLKMTLPAFEAGDEVTFEKEYLFIKTDKGWLLKQELSPSDTTHSL
jgi:hypothetical protein